MALTNLYGVNYKKSLVDEPSKKVHQGEYGGQIKYLRDEITLDGDATSGQAVKVGRLPPGALVIGARVFGPDLGGTGTLLLGNSASLDGSAADTADDDSFITAADSSGQAFDVSDNASAAMRGAAVNVIAKRFTKAVDVELKFSGATASATGLKVTTEVQYIVD